MNKQPYSTLSKIVWVCGVLYTLLFLFSCLTPYIPSTKFKLLTFAALLFPYLFFGYLVWLFIVFFIFKRRRWLFLLLLLPAWKNTSAVFSLHKPVSFISGKDSNTLRVLSWNVNGFLYAYGRGDDVRHIQTRMIDFIRFSGADVLCFQDYTEAPPGFGHVSFDFLRDSLGYPYYHFSNDCDNSGTVIFSRVPIIDSGQVVYPGKGFPESLSYVSVPWQHDTLHIYNTHLRSMLLHTDSLKAGNVGYLKFVMADTAFLFHSDRKDRMVFFDSVHIQQAAVIKQQLNKTKGPFIFCADLNSVPSSYVYNYIKRGIKDAFLEAGSGLGGTYHHLSFTLRIDVVLMSPQVFARQYYSPQPELSDHYPIITDIQLRR